MTNGAYILGCAGPALSDRERGFFREADPWGFILFARNVETPAQLLELTEDLRDAVGRRAPILIDQEGGRVQRLKGPIWREYPPALDQTAAVAEPNRVHAMWLRGALIGLELRAAGIDVNCAPLADIARAATHPVLKNRLYGYDVETVVKAASALAEGGQAAGVAPVVKHLPGYGLAEVDSHLDLPRVSAPLEELTTMDFAPFRALCHFAMGMTAHIVLDAVDPDRPATVSPTAMAVIRDDIGFGGLLMTDDISMEALSGPVEARALAARAAGCDIILHCNGEMDEMERIAAAIGPLDGDGAARAALAASSRPSGDDLDEAALWAEYTGLMA